MIEQTIGPYRIRQVIGRGGMGIVYKAIDTALEKEVAVKVMHPLLVREDRFLRRFKAEARALGRLQHPHIVNIFALQHIDPHLFLVMEYIGGGTLKDLISQQHVVAWEQALSIMHQTLQAIAYAHQAGILHRDIKPRNILLTHQGHVKVTDFGLAKILNSDSDSLVKTRTGLTGGTLRYMPPEQLNGLTHVDHRSDIYSLGMSFYELLSGRTPFAELHSEFAVLKAIEAHDFPALHLLKPNLPPGLGELVMKAVEQDPADRFASAQTMLDAFEDWQEAWCKAKPVAAQVIHQPLSMSPNQSVLASDVTESEPDEGSIHRIILNLSTTIIGVMLLGVLLLYPGSNSVFEPSRTTTSQHTIQDPGAIPEADPPQLAAVPSNSSTRKDQFEPERLTQAEAEQRVVEEAGPGLLRILVRPFGDIYINGTLQAQETPAPYEVTLDRGTHQIRVIHPILGMWEKEVELESDNQEVLFNFNQQFILDITSNVPGGTIYIDGASTGLSTPAQVTLRPGQHRIQVNANGTWSDVQILSVESDRIENPVHFDFSSQSLHR